MIAILRREWLVAWRDRKGFALRFLYAGGLLAAGLVLWLVQLAGAGLAPDRLAAFAWGFFTLLGVVQFMLASLVGSVVFARTIVREKESGALELLVASPLTAAEILLGKLLGELAAVGFVLLAGLPVLCYLLVLGGVAPAELAAIHVILIGQLMFVAAVAVVLATVFERYYAVMIGTLLVVGGVMLAGLVWGVPGFLRPFAPFELLQAELATPGASLGAATGALATGGLSLVLAVTLGSFLLERHVREAHVRGQPRRRSVRRLRVRLLLWFFSARLRGANPLLERETALGDRFRMAWLAWVGLCVVLYVALLPVYGHEPAYPATFGVSGLAAAVLVMALSSALSLTGEKRDGTVEVLLSADVEPREIVEAKIFGQLIRAAYMMAPLLLHVWFALLAARGGLLDLLEIAVRVTWTAAAYAAICVVGGVWISARVRSATLALVLAILLFILVMCSMPGMGMVLGPVWLLLLSVVLISCGFGVYAHTLRVFRRHGLRR